MAWRQAWARAWDEIAPDLRAVLLDMLTTADGETITRAQMLRSTRLRKALQVVADRLADLAAEAGVRITGDLQGVVDTAGIAFLFAPLYHPALRHAALVRRELGIPTVFNFLGPLANPAQPSAQAVGVAGTVAVNWCSTVGVLLADGSWIAVGIPEPQGPPGTIPAEPGYYLADLVGTETVLFGLRHTSGRSGPSLDLYVPFPDQVPPTAATPGTAR